MTLQSPVKAAHRVVMPAVITDYVLTHLGYFAIMPILPLLLENFIEGPSRAAWTGIALGAMIFMARGGSLFVGGWMHRGSVHRAVAAGLILAAMGFTLTSIVSWPILVTLALAAVGLGFSINGIAMRGYVALCVQGQEDRNTIFSLIQILVNLAAAVGPVIAYLLMDHQAYRAALLGSGGLFMLAAVVVPCKIQRGCRLDKGATRPPLKLCLFREIIVDPGIRRTSLVVFVGGILYGQFFSSFPVMVHHANSDPFLRAGFYTLNALLIVAFQIPVTRFVNRLLARRVRPVTVLVWGVMVFGLAFLLSALGGQSLLTAYLTIAVFSVGETIYTPMVNTAFLSISKGRPIVEIFNLRQIATAAGESLGALIGGWMFLEATSRSWESMYWGVLAVLAMVPGAAVLLNRMRPYTKKITNGR